MSADDVSAIPTRPVSQSVAQAAGVVLNSMPVIETAPVHIPEVVAAPTEEPTAAAAAAPAAEVAAAATAANDRSGSVSYSGTAATATNSESAAASAASSPAGSRRATATSVSASDSASAVSASVSQLAPIPDSEVASPPPATASAAAEPTAASGEGSAPPPMPRLPTLLAVEVTVAQQRSTTSLTAPLASVAETPAPAPAPATASATATPAAAAPVPAAEGAPESETMADGKFKTLNRPLRANAANNSTSNGETKAGDTVLITNAPPATTAATASAPAATPPAQGPTQTTATVAPAPIPAPAAGRAALASLIANKSAPPSIPSRPGATTTAPATSPAPGVKPPKPANPPPPLSTVTSSNGADAVLSPSHASTPISHPALPPTPNGAAAPAVEDKAAKQARLRLKVLDEILDTERAYVSNLQALSDHLIGPITSRSVDSDLRLLNAKEIAEMFSNITHILQLNTIFLRDLARRAGSGAHWSTDPANQNIGEVFLQFVPAMKMYGTYTCNHEAANNLLAKLANNERWNEFCSKASAHKDCKGNSLASFLIMPIQRIPRYKLLLTSLMDLTSATHPDRRHLTRSLELVSEVATYINEQVRRQENREEQRQLEEKFVTNPNFLKDDHMLLRTGEVVKLSRSADQAITFFLFSDSLVYAKKVGWKYKLSQCLPIDLAFHVSEPKQKKPPSAGAAAPSAAAAAVAAVGTTPAAAPVVPTGPVELEIVSAKKSFTVRCKDAAEKKMWFEAITAVVEQRRKALAPNSGGAAGGHAHGHGHARPVWQQDKTEKECPLCSKEFGFLTRRHHCRKCGSLCCDNCSKARVQLLTTKDAPLERICDPCKVELAKNPTPAAAAALPPGPIVIPAPGLVAGAGTISSKPATVPPSSSASAKTPESPASTLKPQTAPNPSSPAHIPFVARGPAPPSGPPPPNQPNVHVPASLAVAGLTTTASGAITPRAGGHGHSGPLTPRGGAKPATDPAEPSNQRRNTPPIVAADSATAATPATATTAAPVTPAPAPAPAATAVTNTPPAATTPAPVPATAPAAATTTTTPAAATATVTPSKAAPPKPTAPKPALISQLSDRKIPAAAAGTATNPAPEGVPAPDQKSAPAAAAVAAPTVVIPANYRTVLDLPASVKLTNTFRIPMTEIVSEGGNKFVIYKIRVKGAGDGTTDLVSKRFSQFQDFDKLLRRLFPSYLSTVTFPPAKMFGNFDTAVIEERRQAFQVWLDAIVEHRELWPAIATWLNVDLARWKL